MEPARADPSPCERCGHRQDMHELFRGLRVCRACNYIALRWPCSTTTMQERSVIDALTFRLEGDADTLGP